VVVTEFPELGCYGLAGPQRTAQAAAKAAFKGRAEVRHYPCDHFDVWPGADCFEAVLAHQVAFLRRKLASAPLPVPTPSAVSS